MKSFLGCIVCYSICVILLLTASTYVAQAQSNKEFIIDESFDGYNINEPLNSLNGGKGWKGPWSGNGKPRFIMQPVMSYNDGAIASLKTIAVVPTAEEKIYRQLAVPVKDWEGTIWIRFFYKQSASTERAGLLLLENDSEKLFIGQSVVEGKSNGKKEIGAQLNDERMHLFVARIDFAKGKDIAYVFIDPGTASVPDPEGANVTITGNFSFDRICLLAGAGQKNLKNQVVFGPLRMARKFEEAVAMATSLVTTSQTGAVLNMKVMSWKKERQGLVIITSGGVLQLAPLRKTLKVQFSAKGEPDPLKSFAVTTNPVGETFTVKEGTAYLSLTTTNYTVRVIKATSRIQLFDNTGKLLIEESLEGGREPVANNHIAIKSSFSLTNTEALFGLGQFRDGFLNLRNHKRELVQFNTQAAVPVLLSTNGWGLFWDNPSRTLFSDSPKGMLLSSDEGNEINYYLFVGKQLDDLIAQYRNLTGTAPMLPRWALGYHQSRNKYGSQEEVIAIAERMRKEKIPFSSIFIDYYYWGKYGTGSHQFDEQLFPDIRSLADKVHKDFHGQLIATVWPTFKPGTSNYEAMKNGGFLLEGVKALDGTVYDAFNPKAAALYWEQVKKGLLPTGIDGWFLDGPEPDNAATFLPATTYYGPAAKVRNVFPLVHSKTFYEGLLKYYPNQRPYLLTRCAWASQQKNGTAIWSGDIPSTFDELKKQIPAGLNFVAAGIPYWTTDIGGYSGGNPLDTAYREVYTRWFQYGTFCPIFRSHGRRFPGNTKGPNELWTFGSEVQKNCTSFDMLRYRLMPYIYSLSGNITRQHYTSMRLLAFDFPNDSAVFNIADQFMYGPAMLINPVTDAGVRQRKVYLPKGTDWINFWNGEKQKGGQVVTADAPIDRIPIFIRAGSIIPMGREMQYTDELSNDTLELRVYTGSDGQFELYEDDGKTFNYKNGDFRRTLFTWNDENRKLSIRNGSGHFKGIAKQRTFHIVWVGPNNGTGVSTAKPDRIIQYSEEPVDITF